MSFWTLHHPSSNLALIDEETNRRWTYGDLKRTSGLFSSIFSQDAGKQLVFIQCSNTAECVSAYLGSLQSNAAAALFSADISPELFSRLIAVYSPDWLFASDSFHAPSQYSLIATMGNYGVWGCRTAEREIHTDLALLLSTSGTTGTPKLVRLSYANLQANAVSICEYLGLNQRERPVTSLPMAYSYGLSVINSHLLAGAAIILTNKGVFQKEFWKSVHAEKATSFAGVPYTYQMLLRARLLSRTLPIQTWTQAGGRLAPKCVEQVYAITQANGHRFYVMYGQTEATARIAYVPAHLLGENVGSIGIPIPGGRLRVQPSTGELIYNGPNVMLGYAQNAQDLSRGNELHGELYTGDLARQGENGLFYITGRAARFLKVLGLRLSLDDIEATLGRHFDTPVACFGTDDALQVAVEDSSLTDSVRQFCCDLFKLHHSVVCVSHVERLPLTATGKTDYNILAMLNPPPSKLGSIGQ